MAKKKSSNTDTKTEQDQIANWLKKNAITKVDRNVGGEVILKGFASRRNTFKKKPAEEVTPKSTKTKK